MPKPSVALGPLLALLLAATLPADAATTPADWPQFRGPNGQGLSSLAPPPARFGPGKNLAWSVPVPPGHSSPVLAGQRLFLTAHEDGKLHTLAFDRATGKLLWRKPAPARSVERTHAFASPASPTPLVAGDRLVVYFGSFGLLCYDLDGKELWTRPLPTPKSTYGTASSPIRVGDAAVVVLDSNDKASKLLAVKLADGSTAWETHRPFSISGWATPMLWEHDGTAEIVVLGSRRLVSYDAKTGRDLWWIDGYPPETIGVPVAADGLLFVSASGLGGPPAEKFETMTWKDMLALDRNGNGDGKVQRSEVPENFRFTLRPELPPDNPGRYLPAPFLSMFDGIDGNRDGELTEAEFAGLVRSWSARAQPALRAIRPGGNGDVTRTHVAWRVTRGIPEIPSPLYHRGRVYLVRDGGFLTAVKAADGQVLFQERVGALGAYVASPVAAGDHLYVASHNGVVTCVDVSPAAGDALKVLANNDLGEKIWATPALAEGTIYVRTEKRLWAFVADR